MVDVSFVMPTNGDDAVIGHLGVVAQDLPRALHQSCPTPTALFAVSSGLPT